MCCIGQHTLTHPEHTHSPAAPSKQQDVSLALTCQPACRQHAQRSHATADGTAAGRYSGISLRLCAHGNFANVLRVSKLPECSDAVRKVEGQVLKGGHMTAAEQACDLAKAFVKDAGWQEVDCHQAMLHIRALCTRHGPAVARRVNRHRTNIRHELSHFHALWRSMPPRDSRTLRRAGGRPDAVLADLNKPPASLQGCQSCSHHACTSDKGIECCPTATLPAVRPASLI